jgi:phage tail-like protein
MTIRDPSDGTLSDTLTGDLLAVVRRHDPAWTGSNASDPGVTLLEIGGWIAERIGAAGGVGTAARRDPYRDFNFRVKWDGVEVAGIARISALRRTADIVEYRDGSEPQAVQRMPGRQVCQPFALERALGTDTAFEDWIDQLRQPTGGTGLRKNVRVEILDPAGRLFLAYDVLGCWPAAYRILPDLSESLTLVPEDWHRDRSVS